MNCCDARHLLVVFSPLTQICPCIAIFFHPSPVATDAPSCPPPLLLAPRPIPVTRRVPRISPDTARRTKIAQPQMKVMVVSANEPPAQHLGSLTCTKGGSTKKWLTTSSCPFSVDKIALLSPPDEHSRLSMTAAERNKLRGHAPCQDNTKMHRASRQLFHAKKLFAHTSLISTREAPPLDAQLAIFCCNLQRFIPTICAEQGG